MDKFYVVLSKNKTERLKKYKYILGEDTTRLMCFFFKDEAEDHLRLLNSLAKSSGSDEDEFIISEVRVQATES